MSGDGLRLTGPHGRDYVLGEAIDVFDGAVLIGQVQSVTPNADRTEVLIKNFVTVDFASFRAGALPKLVLAEVVGFLAERFPSLQMVGIELSRNITDFDGQEALLARARADILQSIGAQDIHVAPKPQRGPAGHFAVTGIWRYDSASIAALGAALQALRTAYRAGRNGSPQPAQPRPGMVELLRKKRKG